WPGNVRELENLIRRISAIYPQEKITATIIETELAETGKELGGQLDQTENFELVDIIERYMSRYFAGFGDELPPPRLYDRIIREVEAPLISAALSATRGNQIKAAELLGLNRNTLRNRIRTLNIQVVKTPSHK
ncbi:MAG: nitrogen regulation protein NR(I), partial [Hyphomicrobiaceae bacterium]|nr:nitrogen regulation protein NR(I) [Hyphomicrobiaceae bacterium]